MTKALSPLQVELTAARHSLAFFKGQVKFLAAKVKEEKLNSKVDKIAARQDREAAAAAKRETAIAKAQARLEKLLAKQAQPVGVKALKANRKPSKVVTYGAEDNAIASAIMAKKRSV
jgi:uncharacterized protein YdaU (DUF1376 family)